MGIDPTGKIMFEQSRSTDQRRNMRFDVLECALVKLTSQPTPVTAVIVDISLGGMQSRCRQEIQEGSQCILAITQGGEEPIEVQAEVRYCRKQPDSELYSVGFRFLYGKSEQRMKLVAYIHDVFQRQSSRSIR